MQLLILVGIVLVSPSIITFVYFVAKNKNNHETTKSEKHENFRVQ